MARIRTIKPEFWRDELLAGISPEAALLAIGLLNHCDDEGYFNANPKLVESDVFPLRTLSTTTTVLLRELSGIGYIEVFSGSDGKTYGKVANFEKHQVINKKTSSKIKDLCELPYDYGSPTEPLPVGKERKGKEVEKEKPPSAAEIRFDRFWKAYPKKVGKFDAQKSFERRKVDDALLEKMLRAIDTQSMTDSWRKDNGQFIPNPSTWINQGRWEDEGVTVASAPPVNKGPDPALLKIEEDRKRAAPMPDHIRKQIMSVVRKV